MPKPTICSDTRALMAGAILGGLMASNRGAIVVSQVLTSVDDLIAALGYEVEQPLEPLKSTPIPERR